MTREQHVYRLVTDEDEKITLQCPAWAEPPRGITVTDVGGHTHLFDRIT